MRCILASASDRRKELLSRIVEKFEVIVSNFDEDSITFNGNVEAFVKSLSEGKAKAVQENNITDNSIIIGADTIVVINNCILGKPKDKTDAFNMIKLLSGNVHRVYSAVTVINTSKNLIKTESLYTEVYFSDLTDEEIWSYINRDESLDKAGAYGIQGFGGVLVEKINGCYYNVVGLPLNLLNKMIQEVI